MRSDCILLEPSAALRGFCTGMLAAREIEMRVANNTIGALGAICERSPALAISSVALPDLPGRSLIAALRERPTQRAIPTVILSGDTESYLRLSRQKPDMLIAKDSKLETNLNLFLDKIGLVKPCDQVVEVNEQHESLVGRRILLAEDSHFNQLATIRVLHVAGAEVVVVENGREAIDAVGQSKFDMVLIDIEMPMMDGRKATVELRSSGSLLPILAMTGHDRDEFKVEAESLGFDAVLPKMLPGGDLVDVCLDFMAVA